MLYKLCEKSFKKKFTYGCDSNVIIIAYISILIIIIIMKLLLMLIIL